MASLVTFQHPFTMLIAGPTGSGKTFFVSRLIKYRSRMIYPPIERIIWCYSKWQRHYETLKNDVNQWVKGLDFEKYLKINPQTKKPYNTLVVIDDLQREAQDGSVAALFERGSHHDNISVVYISQNIFHQGRDTRDISLNSHYLILFKSPRDLSQITYLAKQVYPKNVHAIQDIFNDATGRPYGYLVLDFKQTTPDTNRFKTNLLPDEKNLKIYIPKSKK